MNLVYEKRKEILASDADMWQSMRFSALFRCLQEASIAHTEELGAGRDKTLDRGLLWVLTRMKLEIVRLPVYGENVILRSWPGDMMHAIFPRYYTMQTDAGERLLRASGLWLLMNREKRSMAFPQESGIFVPGIVLGDEPELPGGLKIPAPEMAETRTVRYSDIDLNGHVNNARFLDWIDDLLPVPFHQTHSVSSLQINFLSETKPDQEVVLHWSLQDGTLFVSGQNGKALFEAMVKYRT